MRIEEIPVVGAIQLQFFQEDKAAFVDFSSVYDDPFETDFTAKLTAVAGVVSTRFHINEIEKLTDTIQTETKSIIPQIKLLEKYVILAKANLTINVDMFGFKEVRAAIRSGDTEAVNDRLKILFENVDANLVEIENKGLKDADYLAMKAVKQKIFDDNVQQEKMKADKEKAVQDNKVLFKEVETVIKDLQDTGKRLFMFTDKAKTKNYTMSTVLNRIRQERSQQQEEQQQQDETEAKKGMLDITVKDFGVDDSFIEDAEIVPQGTDIIEMTDETGNALIELPAGIYILSIKKDTYEDQLIPDVEIKAGETTEIIVELKAIPNL